MNRLEHAIVSVRNSLNASVGEAIRRIEHRLLNEEFLQMDAALRSVALEGGSICVTFHNTVEDGVNKTMWIKPGTYVQPEDLSRLFVIGEFHEISVFDGHGVHLSSMHWPPKGTQFDVYF